MQRKTTNIVDIGRIEDYLTTIYRFEEALGVARTTDISKELGVTPATVSKIIKKLEERNLVKRVKYKHITLTASGRRLAEQIIRKHRISETFLVKMLGFNEFEAHIYAHYLEHLPDVIIEKIFDLVGKPSRCPHGNPIPGSEEGEDELTSLSFVNKGVECVVKRIAGEFTGILEFIHSLGIKMGRKLDIIERNQRHIIIELEDSSCIRLPNYLAKYIFVKCYQNIK